MSAAPRLEDLYAEVRECVRELKSAGFEVESNELDTALCGSTSGEILGDLGAALSKRVLRQALAPPLAHRLRALLRDVDRVLADAGRI